MTAAPVQFASLVSFEAGPDSPSGFVRNRRTHSGFFPGLSAVAVAWFQDYLTVQRAHYAGYPALLGLGFTVHGSIVNPYTGYDLSHNGAGWLCRVEDEAGRYIAFANSTHLPPGPGGAFPSRHTTRLGANPMLLNVFLSVYTVTDVGFSGGPPVSSGTWDTLADYNPSVDIRTSTDLLHWATVLSTTLGPAPFEFKDSDSPAQPGRFHRVRPP